MFDNGDYPFLDLLFTMTMFFLFIVWLWILITVFSDLFRRKDASGFKKTLWVIFLIVLPYLGTFIYLIANGRGMAERNIELVQQNEAQMANYIRSVGGGDPTAQIARGKELLDSGAITQAEFDSLKKKALS